MNGKIEEELKQDLKLEDLPTAPIPPETDECCGSGCIRCVYDIYEIQLEQYKKLVSKIEERNKEKLEKINQLTNNNNNNNNNNNSDNNKNENNNNDNISNTIDNDDNECDLVIEYENNENDSTINESLTSKNDLENTISECNNLLNGLFKGELKIGWIVSYKVLSGDNSPNRIYHLDIKTNENVSYIPGDYISILAPNESDLVNKLLKRLKLGDGNQRIKINIIYKNNNNNNNNSNSNNNKFNHLPLNNWVKIIDLFKWVLNISYIPPQYFLRILSEFYNNNGNSSNNNEDERLKLIYLSSSQGKQLYNDTIVEHKINLVSLLCKFKHCDITLKNILINIPPHETRKYSISSSPLTSGNHNFHITFNLVKINNNNNNNNNTIKEKFGLCTHWMHNQIQLFKQLINNNNNNNNNNENKIYLPFSIEKSNSQFNLPDNLSTPIILIATGTGLAPFRSFLHHRYYQIQDLNNINQQQKQNHQQQSEFNIGECLLFFGCKRKDWDHIYSDELKEFEKDGIISKLFISYSQQKSNENQNEEHFSSGYINKLIEDNGEMIYNLIINNGGIIYVCGNKNKIGKSINNSLIEIIKKFNNFNIKSNQEAELLLENWIKIGKYKRDVWN
ncbi:hypothetical protein ACTFIR_011612 [Dictyostelium discoideum]